MCSWGPSLFVWSLSGLVDRVAQTAAGPRQPRCGLWHGHPTLCSEAAPVKTRHHFETSQTYSELWLVLLFPLDFTLSSWDNTTLRSSSSLRLNSCSRFRISLSKSANISWYQSQNQSQLHIGLCTGSISASNEQEKAVYSHICQRRLQNILYRLCGIYLDLVYSVFLFHI